MKIKKGYKYWLVNMTLASTKVRPDSRIVTDWYILDQGTISLSKGYAWNGASGPTIDTDAAIYASAFHDAFYQMLRNGELPMSMRKLIDEEFYRMLVIKGMWKVRAWYWYKSVRIFGKKAATKSNENPVQEI